MLGLNEPGEEKRQCVTKTMAAGVLWRRLGRRPTLDEVNEEDRRASRKPRRLGVTPGMLVQIGNQFLNTPGTFGEVKVDAMMVQAALLTAWFFMMRASEFCDSSGLNVEGVLRGVDVKLTKDGEPAEFGCADEVTVQFRKTKADQEAFGSCKAMGFPMPGQSHGLPYCMPGRIPGHGCGTSVVRVGKWLDAEEDGGAVLAAEGSKGRGLAIGTVFVPLTENWRSQRSVPGVRKH